MIPLVALGVARHRRRPGGGGRDGQEPRLAQRQGRRRTRRVRLHEEWRAGWTRSVGRARVHEEWRRRARRGRGEGGGLGGLGGFGESGRGGGGDGSGGGFGAGGHGGHGGEYRDGGGGGCDPCTSPIGHRVPHRYRKLVVSRRSVRLGKLIAQCDPWAALPPRRRVGVAVDFARIVLGPRSGGFDGARPPGGQFGRW